MKRFIMTSLAFLLVALFYLPVYADSIRCGQKVVCTGDSKFDVIKTCGEPILREHVGIKTLKQGASWITINIEKWTYDMGPCQFPKVLIFYGSTLGAIEHGKKY